MLEQNDTISGTPEVERLQGKISETYNEVTGLNEVENTAKLLGVETFSSTREEERIQGHNNRTDDVTEQNEDENNVNLVEGDKTFSSIQAEDLLGKAPGTDDLVEGDQTFSSTLQTLQGRISNTEAVTALNGFLDEMKPAPILKNWKSYVTKLAMLQ
ncbi:TMV resistance protein N-like [Prunus yedoensis var. nudiflora]|uniref:TMV resistance protein N-like n=1 Tax=Prunus yedoensis var. nudiflora TaxID=2094558 RepID=A0A314XUQ0_PRUYE|nr:TMV resistance protein N-like [Prunus yedoensis var. nudiflora]